MPLSTTLERFTPPALHVQPAVVDFAPHAARPANFVGPSDLGAAEEKRRQRFGHYAPGQWPRRTVAALH